MRYSRKKAEERLTELMVDGQPFFFFTDFEGTEAFVIPLAMAHLHDLEFSFSRQKPISFFQSRINKWDTKPIALNEYKKKWTHVHHELAIGNTYLVNLTFPTKLETDLTLRDLYQQSHARYKVRYANEFVFFSPETFVTISDQTIKTYPMKGTISANEPDALNLLLNNTKELAEHVTVVDLLRNDLSQVASEVHVPKFRFPTRIETNKGPIIQLSSEISGKLPMDWKSKFGSWFFSLLPAGSISGAPKQKTISIIKNIEDNPRGFYSGVCGLYDGLYFDSCVMIRFVEQRESNYYFRSGGGITFWSNPENEYKELLQKVYLPT